MAVLVGIDEVGYGPLLGPLVVSSSVFEVPDGLIEGSLWEVLSQSVCSKPARSAGRVVIGDSKKLHKGVGCYDRLQRGVLACLVAGGQEVPEKLGQLLGLLGADCGDQLGDYPWYGLTVDDYPLSYDRSDIATAAAGLAGEFAGKGIHLCGLWSRLLCVKRYNEMVAAVDNKASVLFTLLSELVDRAHREFGEHNLQILVDKQGGRSHYRRLLQRLFPDLQMKILKESETTSSYQLTDPGRASRRMKVHFLAKGESRQLPIALASMTSKYVRELFMDVFNGYFQRHCPGVTPTAGYYKDAKRFLADLNSRGLAARLAPEGLLVRQR